MKPPPPYSYQETVKSTQSDELINTYVLRPLAGLLVRLLYPTRVTPNQVTLAGIGWGFLAAFLYTGNSSTSVAAAGVCLTLKDLFDSADGQLARAKQLYSRAGRFLDSIGDFIVNALVFSSFSLTLWKASGDPEIPVMGLLAFLGISLRVSYHVFYQTSYLHLHERYWLNRTTEELREEDRRAEPAVRRLQTVFQLLYGWQDRLMVRLDGWSQGGLPRTPAVNTLWYSDGIALRLSGFLGLGTELFLLTACSLLDSLRGYLLLNLIGMNGLWLACIVYRKVLLKGRIVRLRG